MRPEPITVAARSTRPRARSISAFHILRPSITPSDMLRLVVGEGMKLALIGIVAGLLGALALGRAVSSLVFGAPVRDPLTFTGVAVVLAGVALAACTIPALRASRVDPIVALRYE